MTVIHLIYPFGAAISCPQAIGRNLAAHLSLRFEVKQYQWDETGILRPGRDDILLGHPHPLPHTIFRRSLRQAGWRRILLLCPYNHDILQVAHLESVMSQVDLYLAITGRYWFDSVESSEFAHWRPKMVHLDLAVDRRDFPPVKARFNPPGRRRILYIGHSGRMKNLGYLSEIARRMPDTPFSWIGGRSGQHRGLCGLGYRDFRTPEAQGLVTSHDFLVTVSTADANPATILEAMAWGLIPVCTPQCGYSGYPGIINVPLGDAAGAVRILRTLQDLPEAELFRLQDVNRRLLDSAFTWEVFGRRVVDAIQSNQSPPLGRGRISRSLLHGAARLVPLLSPRLWRSAFRRWRTPGESPAPGA